jgi:hypothetical protein
MERRAMARTISARRGCSASGRRLPGRTWHCLRPGGILVMELMHRDRVAHLCGQPIEHPGGLSETGHTDWMTGIRTSPMTYGSIVKTSASAATPSPNWSTCCSTKAGFSHVDAYGALRGGELSPESRLALRAVK